MSLMGTPTGHLTNLSTAASMMDYLSPGSGGMLPGSKFRDCADCPEMVVVPAGTFMMGAPESEADSDRDERPVHAVSVPLFAAGVYEVTFAEWDACSELKLQWSDPNDFFRSQTMEFQGAKSLGKLSETRWRTKWLTKRTVNPERP